MGLPWSPTKPSSCWSLPALRHCDGLEPRHKANHYFHQQRRMSNWFIKSYSQINKATLFERFCKPGQPHAQTCSKQNNTMMSISLAKSLMVDAQARLLTYRNKYTFDGMEYAPSCTRSLHILLPLTLLPPLRPFGTTCSCWEFMQRLLVATVTSCTLSLTKITHSWLPGGQPLTTSLASFFIFQHHKDYLDGKLTAITHEAFMTSAKCKFDWLKTKEMGGAKSPNDKKNCGNDRRPQCSQGPA